MKTTTRLELIDGLYDHYSTHAAEFEDPVTFLKSYDNMADREVVAMIASSLAYGRVAHIMNSVREILKRIGAPHAFVMNSIPLTLAGILAGFRHRFASGAQMAELLNGIRHVLKRYESLETCFTAVMRPDFDTVAPAMGPFVAELRAGMTDDCGHLLPVPENGSACKRLALFLRWMVRCDTVDVGGWRNIPASRLLIPLDTHVHRIGQALGLTRRKNPDMRAALEITDALRAYAPDDPVKYDFALMRLSIDNGERLQQFIELWHKSEDETRA